MCQLYFFVSFSCNCNSIHSYVSIVLLRAISSFLFHCCVCINTTAFPIHLQFNFVQQCIQISTRINSSSVHTYICVCFIQNQYNTSNIQYGVRIDAVFASLQGEHTDWKEREDIQGEILQSSNIVFSTGITTQFQCFHMQSSHPMQGNYSTYRINSSTRILQEILQLQGSSHADRYKASSSNCSPCIQAFYMAETLPATL